MGTDEIRRPAALTPIGQEVLRRLMREWFEFERRLAVVPIVRRLDLGTFTRDDYRLLLLNLYPHRLLLQGPLATRSLKASRELMRRPRR